MMSPSVPTRSGIDRIFLFSSYFTLFVACASLAWSEVDFLREIPFIAAVVGVLLVVAYFAEGKWTLSIAAANWLGVGIGLAAIVWVGFKVLTPGTEGTVGHLPWPTSMVPLLGPLLLVLLLAKLFRPKTINDHWGLQLIGLVCVGLGCALGDDPVFGVLLVTYLVSLLWSLALFFVFREQQNGQSAAISRSIRFSQLGGWAFLVAVLAFVGFFALPRSSAVWQLPRQVKKLETGITEEAGLDLNRTGPLTLDPEVAFEVYAEQRNGQPKLDLSSEQRWRGPVYRVYLNGNWRRTAPNNNNAGAIGAVASAPTNNRNAPPPDDNELPDYGRADQYYLTYIVKNKIGPIPFISDPLYRPLNTPIPIVSLLPDGTRKRWLPESDSVFRPTERVTPQRTRYRQVTVPPPASNLGHEFAPSRFRDHTFDMLLQAPPLEELAVWVSQLLERLVASGALPREAITKRDDRGFIHPSQRETVARALEQHLSSSGEYSYTLTLEREDMNRDPTDEFLRTTKVGHCNRFASALAVMLRLLQIPCQVVSGFRGADSRGDGMYDVRQCHAHTWVEVYVPKEEPGPAHGLYTGRTTWHWLTLDPTPGEAADASNAAGQRWWSFSFDPDKLFRNLIVNYTASNRDEFLQEVNDSARGFWAAFKKDFAARTPEGFRLRLIVLGLTLMVGAALIVIVRFARRRWRLYRGSIAPWHPGTNFYRRMLSILSRRGWKPTPWQTPAEFATQVSNRLLEDNKGADMALVIRDTATLYYRVRYGERALNTDELKNVNANLDNLARILAAGRN